MPGRPIKKSKKKTEELFDEEELDMLEEEFEEEEEEEEDDDYEDDDSIEEGEEEEEEYEDEDEEEEEEYEDDVEVDEYDVEEEEYDYEEKSKIIPYAVMAIALVAFVSLGYYAYNSGTENIEEGELMLIQADNTPVKEKPMDPGGMKFPYQDKSVFETITEEAPTQQPLEVVSSVEEPLKLEPETSSISQQELQPAETVKELVAAAPEAETQPAVTEPAATIAEKPVAEVKQPAPALVKEAEPEKPTEQTMAATEAKELEKLAPAALKPAEEIKSASGSEMVQLGAYRSSKDAEAAWEKARSSHTVLSSYTPTIVRADLGEKGVFYRLRVSGVDASSMCGTLKTNGQACIVVK